MNLFEIKGLCKSYNGHDVLKNCDVDIKSNECVVILGKSGSGKSTLLDCIANFLPYDCTYRNFKGKLGYMFQTPELFPWLTVSENICFPHAKAYKQEDLQFYCEQIGLQGYESYFPKQLSLGMQQRVSLARSLIRKPDLLLLDEPFSSLDYFLKQKMYQSLLQIQSSKQISMLLVTHDLQEAICLGDRIYVLNQHTHELKEVMKVTIKKDYDLLFVDQSEALAMKHTLMQICSTL